MRGTPLFVVLFALAGCKKPAAPPPPPPEPEAPPAAPAGPPGPDLRGLNWEVDNFDGTLRIQQRARAKDDCELQCIENATHAARWTVKGCRATTLDLRFVSPDCTRLMVVYTLPSASAFRYAVLATVWTEEGKAWEVKGGALPIDTQRTIAAGTSFRWLKGVLDAPGERPRYSADGTAVEVESLDGKTHTLPFVPARGR